MQPEYKVNMNNLHELVYDQPMTSLSKAIYWIEYVIRHKGAKHLEFKGKHVPLYQAYCLDFIALFILFIVVSYYISKKVFLKLYTSISIIIRSSKKNKAD